MRTIKIAIAALLLSASAHAQFRSDSCNCPIPDGDPNAGSYGRDIPHFADIQPHRSPDGRYMGYVSNAGESFVMDLSDHTARKIVVHLRHSGEVQDYAYSSIWCPYDPDLILITVRSLVDTSRSGANPVSAFNAYTYRISTGASVCITPDTLGPYGALSKGALTFGASAWLPGSQPGMDSLLIGMSSLVAPEHKQFWGVYLPQKQQLIRLRTTPPDTQTLAVSDDSLHSVWLTHNPRTGEVLLPIMFDQTSLAFTVPLDTTTTSIQRASFSPDGRWVSYWVFPQGNGAPADTIFDQVWICPVSHPTKIEHVLNFQCLYCTYSFWGIYPEFISDSTLAVSMHHDGDSVSALWEIGLDGHIVRQLTHVVSNVLQSNVAAKQPLSVFPNPGRKAITVSMPKAERVHMIDASGREVLSANLPAGISRLNTAGLARGAYIIRSDSADANVVLR